MFRGRCAQEQEEFSVFCPFSLSTGTDAWVLFIVCRPVVKQVQEEVFTSEAFHELDLHPHLVSVSLFFQCEKVCEMTVLGRKIQGWLLCSELPE